MNSHAATPLHRWDVSPKEAIAIQQDLRYKVSLADHFTEIRRVAGVDVGFDTGGSLARAAVAVLTFPGLQLTEWAFAVMRCGFPYVPGLLSFREAPVIIEALKKLGRLPDLILCDGQGIAHQRRFGIASHIGVLTGIPAIGVAKSRLTGTHPPLPPEKGSVVELTEKGETIGMVFRSRTGVKPIYVSPGHKVSFSSSLAHVRQCLTRYRLPETTRHAHRLASEHRTRGDGQNFP